MANSNTKQYWETIQHPILKMTPFVFMVCLMFVFACNQTEKPAKNSEETTDLPRVHNKLLELRAVEGLVFYEDQAFTGYEMKLHNPNQVAASIQYLNGKKNGTFEKWFADGTLSYQASYQDGKQEGTARSWWKNGELRSESNFTNGIADGKQLQWYQSGAKFKEITLVNGKEEGLQKAWRENGKIYNNYEAKNGRIFGLKRANLCYGLEDEEVQFKGKK